jgi:clan AA aspartic protease (TIGR02281 family)
MKWLTYLSTAVTILFIGYWLGNNNSQQTQTTDTVIKPQTSPTIHDTTPSILVSDHEKAIQQTPIPKNRSKTLTDRFRQHLEHRDYLSAMTLLAATQDTSPPITSILKVLYIEHIRQLLTQPQSNNERINNAIDAYLSDFYDDTDVLLLLAKQYAYMNNFYDMLNTVQLSVSYAYTNEQKKGIEAAYSAFIIYTDKLLSEQEQWQALIDFYLHSENTGLLQEQDILRLVELYMKQGDTYLALDYAEELAGKAQWETQLAALLPAPQTEKQVTNRTSISLQKIADQFIITTQLSGNDTNLLIDTGASVTTVSKEYFKSIQQRSHFSFQQKQTFLTANGETTGEIYTVDTFQIGEHQLNNIEIAVIDFPTSQHSSGLLGMNVLRNFKFEIDQVNASLTLEKNPL